MEVLLNNKIENRGQTNTEQMALDSKKNKIAKSEKEKEFDELNLSEDQEITQKIENKFSKNKNFILTGKMKDVENEKSNLNILNENIIKSKDKEFEYIMNEDFKASEILKEKSKNNLENLIEENSGIKFPHYSDSLIDIQINQKISFEKLILDINVCIEKLNDFEYKFFELLTTKEISCKIIEKFYKNHLDFSVIKVYVFFLKRQLKLVSILIQLKYCKKEESEKIEHLQSILSSRYRKLLNDEDPEEKIKFKQILNNKIENLYNITKKIIENYNAKNPQKKSKTLDPSIESNHMNYKSDAKNELNKDFKSGNIENYNFNFKDENNKVLKIDSDYFNINNFAKNINLNNDVINKNIDAKNDIQDINENNIIRENDDINNQKVIIQTQKNLSDSFNQKRLKNQDSSKSSNLDNFSDKNNFQKHSGIKSLEGNSEKIILENHLNGININQETIVNWLIQGDMRLDKNVNKMLELEKLLLDFFDDKQNSDYLPSLTAVGVILKIIIINTDKAIKLVNELSQLKKIRSEYLTINFLTMCNKFELFANYFLLSFKVPHDDLFNKPENAQEWELIRKHLDKQILFSRNKLNKMLDKVFSIITVGMASVSKGFKNKNKSMFNKIVQTGFYMPYFFCFRKNADIQTQKFAINPDFEVAFMIWNMMDCKYIKNIIKLTMPSIKHSKKCYLGREKEELTINKLLEDYQNFLAKVKGETFAEKIQFDHNQIYEKFHQNPIGEKEQLEKEILKGIEREKNQENLIKEIDIISTDQIKEFRFQNNLIDDVNINFSNDNAKKKDNMIDNNIILQNASGFIQSKNEVSVNEEKYIENKNEKFQDSEIIISPKKNKINKIGNNKMDQEIINKINNNIESNFILDKNNQINNPSYSKNSNVITSNIIEEKIKPIQSNKYITVRFISAQEFIVPQHQSFWSKIVTKKDHNNSPRDSLIIHIHGGGFIAMSSGSHEMYTRKWAKKTNIPILSIDYRLAPDNPYPKALDDVYQTYCWVLKYAEEKLLINLKNIILVGDSAGGNLVASLTNLLITRNHRIPNAIFLIYPALRISLSSFSLSMLNVVDDKILPYHLVKFCLEGYRKDYTIENDPFISPLYADDEVLKRYPPVRIYIGTNDPLRDDSFLFMKRLL